MLKLADLWSAHCLLFQIFITKTKTDMTMMTSELCYRVQEIYIGCYFDMGDEPNSAEWTDPLAAADKCTEVKHTCLSLPF